LPQTGAGEPEAGGGFGPPDAFFKKE